MDKIKSEEAEEAKGKETFARTFHAQPEDADFCRKMARNIVTEIISTRIPGGGPEALIKLVGISALVTAAVRAQIIGIYEQSLKQPTPKNIKYFAQFFDVSSTSLRDMITVSHKTKDDKDIPWSK